jgi:hypothetical protein
MNHVFGFIPNGRRQIARHAFPFIVMLFTALFFTGCSSSPFDAGSSQTVATNHTESQWTLDTSSEAQILAKQFFSAKRKGSTVKNSSYLALYEVRPTNGGYRLIYLYGIDTDENSGGDPVYNFTASFSGPNFSSTSPSLPIRIGYGSLSSPIFFLGHGQYEGAASISLEQPVFGYSDLFAPISFFVL